MVLIFVYACTSDSSLKIHDYTYTAMYYYQLIGTWGHSQGAEPVQGAYPKPRSLKMNGLKMNGLKIRLDNKINVESTPRPA